MTRRRGCKRTAIYTGPRWEPVSGWPYICMQGCAYPTKSMRNALKEGLQTHSGLCRAAPWSQFQASNGEIGEPWCQACIMTMVRHADRAARSILTQMVTDHATAQSFHRATAAGDRGKARARTMKHPSSVPALQMGSLCQAAGEVAGTYHSRDCEVSAANPVRASRSQPLLLRTSRGLGRNGFGCLGETGGA